jgi:hypothetical protein
MWRLSETHETWECMELRSMTMPRMRGIVFLTRTVLQFVHRIEQEGAADAERDRVQVYSASE